MSLFKYLEYIDSKIDHIPIVLQCDSTIKYLRKYFIYGQLVSLSLIIVLFIISRLMSVEIFVEYSIVSILFLIVTLAFIFVLEKVKTLILLTKLGYELIVLYFVSKMGGLLTSGGLILTGLAPVLYSLIFQNYKWLISVFSVFMVSICVLFIFNDHLTGKEILSPQLNLTYFLIILLGITSYILLFAIYTQKILIKLEKKDTQRQKEINETKNRLFTNITHEFRTPLTVILGLADNLKSDLSDTISSKADIITKNGKQLLQLVDQLLDLSKIDSGNVSVNKIYGNIIPFLRYTFQLYEYYAQEKEFQFSFLSENQAYEVDFDPEKITAIISNLLSNAIKFTPSGGKIEMCVKRFENDLLIDVIDNGIGIAKENQDKIFDRFYQVNDTDVRGSLGTGIGLALTKELVNLLNGTITFVSVPGVETKFTLRLPISSPSNVRIADRRHSELVTFQREEDLNEDNTLETNEVNIKQRILIIEDNEDVISYLKSCYHCFYFIDFVTDGLKGFHKAIDTIPDIIISDIMMPGMDGFTLCKKLKDDIRTSHIPIILLTAKADIPSRIKGLEQGADAYIVKPFNQKELLVRINKLLELRRKLQYRYSNIEISDLPEDPSLKKEDFFYNTVTGLIYKNLNNEEYNVLALCQDMAMSKSQLYRKFKALTNMSAAKYIRKLRLQKAKQLLLSSSLNITEVSYEVGIKTLSTFSELFKEEYGQSPTEFVHKHKENYHNN